MRKSAPKEVFKRIKEKEQAERKSNYTFRLSDEMMTRLKEKCARANVSVTSVVEELLQDFLLGN